MSTAKQANKQTSKQKPKPEDKSLCSAAGATNKVDLLVEKLRKIGKITRNNRGSNNQERLGIKVNVIINNIPYDAVVVKQTFFKPDILIGTEQIYIERLGIARTSFCSIDLKAAINRKREQNERNIVMYFHT